MKDDCGAGGHVAEVRSAAKLQTSLRFPLQWHSLAHVALRFWTAENIIERLRNGCEFTLILFSNSDPASLTYFSGVLDIHQL